MTPSGAIHVSLPAERFYWAVLDAEWPGGLPRSADARARRLGYLFESVLPVPIESVHAVYRRIGADRWLACGIDRVTLAEYAEALTLRPDSVPGFTGVDVSPDSLNLLVSEFEPAAVRIARRRTTLAACTVILTCAGLAYIGFGRRTAAHTERTQAISRLEAGVYESVLGRASGGAPPAARLTAELRSLERTRGEHTPELGRTDIAPALAALLAGWPRDLHVRTETLSVSAGAMTILARLPDESAAERFERELRPPGGWRGTQPSVQRERDGITVRVRMEAEP